MSWPSLLPRSGTGYPCCPASTGNGRVASDVLLPYGHCYPCVLLWESISFSCSPQKCGPSRNILAKTEWASLVRARYRVLRSRYPACTVQVRLQSRQRSLTPPLPQLLPFSLARPQRLLPPPHPQATLLVQRSRLHLHLHQLTSLLVRRSPPRHRQSPRPLLLAGSLIPRMMRA